MTNELTQQGLNSLLDHHNLQTASSLAELQQRSGLKAPFLLLSIPFYQAIALLMALFAFSTAFMRPSILPFAGMPAGDLAFIALLAIVWHALKRSTASGLLAFALIVVVSFLNPLGFPLMLIAAASLFIYGMLSGIINQSRLDSYRIKALRRILYREERQKRLAKEEEKRQLQQAHVEELLLVKTRKQAAQMSEDIDLDLGPLTPYQSSSESHFAN